MKYYLIGLILFISINTGVQAADNKGITLTVSVSDLRNSNGNVVFALKDIIRCYRAYGTYFDL